MGKVRYPALFYKERNGEYSVVFPDLGHLATSAYDLLEVRCMAQNVLAGYIWLANQDGKEVPPPSVYIYPPCKDDYGDKYLDVWVEDVKVDVEAYAKEHHFGE